MEYSGRKQPAKFFCSLPRRTGGVKTQLGATSFLAGDMSSAGVERASRLVVPYYQVLIGLKTGSHCPFYGLGIVDVDIAIDHDDVFEGWMGSKGGFDRFAAIIRILFSDLYHRMQPTSATVGQYDIDTAYHAD